MRVVFVCTGNTCRSPMAEGILKALKPEFDVISRGLFVPEESSASFNSIEAMQKFDIDISMHRSKQLTLDDVIEADIILTMTASHKKAILSACPDAEVKVYSLSEYAGDEGDIHDPYGGSLESYQICGERINYLISKINWQKR